MPYFCCDEPRRNAVRGLSNVNGIDYLEVGDPNLPTPPEKQLTLYVYLLNPLGTLTITPDNVRIEGGERIRAALAGASGGGGGSAGAQRPNGYFGILGNLFRSRNSEAAVTNLAIGAGTEAAVGLQELRVTQVITSSTSRVVKVMLNTWGDFSRYTFRLVKAGTADPLPGLDPLLSALAFTFKVDCPSDFDCMVTPICPPEQLPEPEIDYLAKDYASFRQIMLDRMAVLSPQWQERSPADLGIALVELLAYVGDHLSYQQDAIATEAYFGTARQRVSMRRHARLVDYYMHDGCNARVWVQMLVNADTGMIPGGTQLFTRVDGQAPRIVPASQGYDRALAQQPVVFETMHPIHCYLANSTLHFYTWGAHECCLPRGSTSATLLGTPPVQTGDVLIFEEALGPVTGQPADANPAHRHAVRLTRVAAGQDPVGGRFKNPPDNTAVDITEIGWDAADALPFPLTVSSRTDEAHGHQFVVDVSVARGNIVLADHGRTIQGEPLPAVPAALPGRVPVAVRRGDPCDDQGDPCDDQGDPCDRVEPEPVWPPFRPVLQQGPVTQTAVVTRIDPHTGLQTVLPFDPTAPAMGAFAWQMRDVLPAISLDRSGQSWQPQHDLLASDPSATDFVAEVDDTGRTTLRFGDGQYGKQPAPDTDPSHPTFTATYRIGNGAYGNVGAETLRHIVTSDGAVSGVRNLLPARGGVEPESIEHVRQSAPSAFRTQERAVTAADYAAVAERHPEVLRAVATFRWTGSWRTVFLTVERRDGLVVDEAFKEEMLLHMERYRMAGHDLEVDGPIYVPLEVEMVVCVQPYYFRSDVKAVLLELFSNRLLPDGRRGVFYPDNFTFGQTVYLSPLYAAAQAVDGVASVQVTTFQRRDTPSPQGVVDGKLTFDRLEIPRLDNDPDFPEHGVFRLAMEGGK